MKAAMVILICIMLLGCAQKEIELKPQVKVEPNYSIVSTLDYDRKQCSSAGNFNVPGFSTGLRAILKDSETGEEIDGKTYISMEKSGMGGMPGGFSCMENITSTKSWISAYTKGYSPIIIEVDLPKDKLTTIEIPLPKSCTNGPSCFDIIDWQTRNETTAARIKEGFYRDIEKQFGLKKEDYALDCMECDMGRGGFIKARGVYKNKMHFELFYHYGWCSSGGSDCGWTMCFSTENTKLYNTIKEKFCNSIASFVYIADRSEPGITKYVKANETTQRLQEECLDGKFQKAEAGKNTISIDQYSSSRINSVSEGILNCIES